MKCAVDKKPEYVYPYYFMIAYIDAAPLQLNNSQVRIR